MIGVALCNIMLEVGSSGLLKLFNVKYIDLVMFLNTTIEFEISVTDSPSKVEIFFLLTKPTLTRYPIIKRKTPISQQKLPTPW